MGNKQNDTSALPVDLIRVVAIFGVLLFHAIGSLATQTVNNMGVLHWWVIVNIYQCIGRIGVPLFIMLTGALLLVPAKKDENISFFFKKRFSRIGLPFLFWGIIYFLWTVYVEKQTITQGFIINGILKGPYFTFWYIYLLLGLYLVTPLLRVMIAHFTDKLFRYFIILWFIGTALVPMIEFLSGWPSNLHGLIFLIPLCTGYFIIGPYFAKTHIQRWILVTLIIIGLALSTIATYFTAGIGGDTTFFFLSNNNPAMTLTNISLFILLNSYVKPQNMVQMAKPSWKQRVMHVISENTLSIYLFHMIVIYAIQWFLGFILSDYTIDPIIGVPFIAAMTLLLSIIIIIPLKKIPGLRKLVG